MKYEIELHEEEIQNLKRIRNYFGIHDKTMLEHMAYAMLDKLVKNLTIPIVSVSLPNEIDLGALANLLKYSNKYEISIQFWPDKIAVFICKDGVDLKDFGGGFDFAVSKSIAYLDRITGNAL